LFQRVQERTGVSCAQLWALAEVGFKPAIRVTQSTQAMMVHQSTAGNLIERLEKLGLIRRDRSSRDQRVAHLSLTRAGRDVVARAPPPVESELPDVLNLLGHADLVELRPRLDRLASVMKVRDRAGKRIPLMEM
jgi:DNA-binding MarR family transcriptional regulator